MTTPRDTALTVVIAPDSFKESASALAAAEAMARGVLLAAPHARTVCIPMADGGEGTIDAILAACAGERHVMHVQNALGAPGEACWALLDDGTAIIEMASAAGLEAIPIAGRDPLRATSHGVGELMRAALDHRARRIVLTLGGSATNDGGAGMLQALGARWFDARDQPLPAGGAALRHLARIDVADLDPRFLTTPVLLAADVRSPLCGPTGASFIYGPQKGATPAHVRQLDEALGHFADVTAATLGHDLRDQPGAGAAGGLGFGALAYLKAEFQSGAAFIAELTGLAAAIRDADLVLTGEGRLDGQTLNGKTLARVAALGSEAGVPVIALVGSLGDDYERMYEGGLTAAFALAPGPCTLEQAYAMTDTWLTARACDVTRLYLRR